MTNWRWVMCAMLFFATTVNYMDRQVLSLTFKESSTGPIPTTERSPVCSRLRMLSSASSPVSSSIGWARRKVTSGRSSFGRLAL